MWPDRVSNPGPLAYDSGALPIALRGPAAHLDTFILIVYYFAPKAGNFSNVLPDKDVGFATVYQRIYRRKVLTVSNHTSREIR